MKSVIAALVATFTLAGVQAAPAKAPHKDIFLQVTEKGFEPPQIDVAPGTDVTLKVTRKTDSTCATEISIPAKKLKKALPLNQTVSVDLGKLEKGEVRFACGMDMISGQIVVK
jgi:plastocyanin domain-containing protein